MGNNNDELAARYAKAAAGLQKHLATVASLVLNGATYVPADLVTLFTSWTAAVAAAAAAKAQWQAAVLAEHALKTKLQAIWLALQAYARLQYGADPATLTDFGFTPPKKAQKSPETFVVAAEKSRATRAARHTLGKDQKKAITGATPAPASPPPAPVPAAKP